MQTKRKQTLLAGAGLLTALTLSVGTLAGCTPSKFTPGPGQQPPTQVNPGTSTPAVKTISGKADFLGTPFANADVKLTNLKTGNVIAVGGGNLKTDAAGNFSVDVPGLAANDVVRVDISNSEGTLSALMGDVPAAPAGYNVAATTPAQVIQTFISGFVNAQTSFITDHVQYFGSFVYGGLAFTGLTFNSVFTGMGPIGDQFDNFVGNSVNNTLARRYLAGRSNPGSNNQNLQEVTQKSGVSSILKETLTAAFKQVAKTDVKVAQAFNGKPLSPGLADSVVKIEGNTVTLNGETFNLDNGGTNNGGQENPTTNPLPPTEQETETEVEDPKGEWVNDGNMSPTVTIGTNSVTVAQDANEVQMVALTMLLPKDNLTGGSIANLSGANLSGTVTGTTRSGAARSGALTFGALDASNKGTITLGTFGQIGTYTVTDEGGTWKVKMTYTFNETGIELVGAHETTVTAASVTLNKKDGMAIVIAGAGASSRIQF